MLGRTFSVQNWLLAYISHLCIEWPSEPAWLHQTTPRKKLSQSQHVHLLVYSSLRRIRSLLPLLLLDSTGTEYHYHVIGPRCFSLG